MKECWEDIVRHFANVELDRYVIMPNHVHGIIVLKGKENDLVKLEYFQPDEEFLRKKYQEDTSPNT